MAESLPVINVAEAKFECTFGRGCEGICCHNGRPFLYSDEKERLDVNLGRILPHLRPAARALVEKDGYLSQRLKLGMPMVRVQDSWCVFFNEGCVLHKIGALEGDKYLYKPAVCALFPLAKDDQDRWFVRQKGQPNEKWDLFCLDPKNTSLSAAESLKDEIELALQYDAAAEDDNEST